MRFVIRHEIRGGVRVHFYQKDTSIRQVDLLHYYLCTLPEVKSARVYERTADAAMVYEGNRRCMLEGVQRFSYDNERMGGLVPKNSGRALNREYREKLVRKVVVRVFAKSFLPTSVGAVYTAAHSVRYLLKGVRCLLRGKLEVEVLGAAAIAVPVLRQDFDTAGSIMFLLGIGESLEEWTHKKSVGDLARGMSLNISGVQQNVDGTEIPVPISEIKKEDLVTVRMGNVVPLDGMIASGDAMVNQASMTGESVPVGKKGGSYVCTGTAVEEGKTTLRVRTAAGDTRFERITTMIEESEQLEFTAKGKTATLAGTLVPWSLSGAILTWLLTRDVTKALSILMVGFSCALKLAMPLSVFSAMREAGNYHVTVKGGRYAEAAAAADTIIFNKTGTLTEARPQVTDVMVFNDMGKRGLLRTAVCLEEHFPHSMAKAMVNKAVRRGLVHRKMHSRVDYIAARGIATHTGDERMATGSHHFVFEDEGCRIPKDKRTIFDSLPTEYSHLHLAIGGSLATIICIEGPLRNETDAAITVLHRRGITKIIVTTEDSERTATAVAGQVGVNEYYSEVLPEDEARFVDEEKKKGRKIIIIGDGINDSPALLATGTGIAISEGAETAREVADITVSESNLFQLATLRAISRALMDRIDRNCRFVIGFNLGLTLLGVRGVIIPAASAVLHNTSTLAINLKSMTNLLD